MVLVLPKYKLILTICDYEEVFVFIDILNSKYEDLSIISTAQLYRPVDTGGTGGNSPQ